MASVVRQPFAPLDGLRLHSLTSLKNRQNGAVASPSPSKRKASDDIDFDDLENVNPVQLTKRAKGPQSSSASGGILKPSSYYHLVTKPTCPSPLSKSGFDSAPASSALRSSGRSVLQPKSPAARLAAGASVPKPSPLSAPAGRSPPGNGKRAGILSRRRGPTSYSRVDPPPAFGLGGGNNAAPFSLEAALKGTIPSYRSKPAVVKPVAPEIDPFPLPFGQDIKASWFFDIHEDTPEQEMTNLLQHSTCALDISSDEESERKATMEKGEGLNKENVPPQPDANPAAPLRRVPVPAPAAGTAAAAAAAAAAASARNPDDMEIVKERRALGDLNVEDYYATGCDQASVFVVPADEDDVADIETSPCSDSEEKSPSAPGDLQLEPEPVMQSIDELMSSTDTSKAAVLQPIDGTGETFDVWESGSAQGEDEKEIQ